MNKKKIIFERELRSRSGNIIWSLISTPEGLTKWIADRVERNGDILEFTWGEPEQHHEKRTARITEEFAMSHLRWTWEDDDNDFVEIRMKRCDITDDYVLTVTDFIEIDDENWLNSVWESNFKRLHHATGI
ncbi:START-like domain-containing protein [Prevotella sp. OH937_COT-195]|uniref:START-like domain-containing protein n=1 Tax=Prevotella sp. OH937_COT-195 TaxID=2491051 RepID=UPI000F645C8F|nr:START-like domain-containing protein [Prevotella sp. OH937_COT-195]RRD02079.1 hypothetical protein EII32_04225 [Prevotella sp. OH937_COT-195]